MPAKTILPTRRLGKNGPEIPALGLGLMGLSVFYGTTQSDEERLKFLDHAYEKGAIHWDSAALYGDSEELIGKWFAKTGKRKDIFLGTKFGIWIDETGLRTDNSPKHIHEFVARSLKRLQTDYIDIFYCHRFTGDVPVEVIIQTLKEYVDKGVIKYIGVSECDADTLRRASKIHPISALQIEYSPFSMDIESEQLGLLKTCRELGIATVAYSPLSRGFLTGQLKSYDDFEPGDMRLSSPRFSKENFPKNLVLVQELEKIAKSKGCTSSQLVLAWLLAQGDDIFPIPGTKKTKYVDENLGALDVSLTPAEVAKIRAEIEKTEVAGDRYAMMSSVINGTIPLDQYKP